MAQRGRPRKQQTFPLEMIEKIIDQPIETNYEKRESEFKEHLEAASRISVTAASEKAKELAGQVEGVKLASEIPPKEKKWEADGTYKISLPAPYPPNWVTEIESYCNEAGCTSQDLIEAHKNSLKPIKKGKEEKPSKGGKSETPSGDSYFLRHRKEKLGF